MKHSDYTELTRRLEQFAHKADLLRMGLTMTYAIDDDGNLVATSNPEQYKVSQQLNRVELWRATVEGDTHLCRYMDGLIDGWTERNQERADKELGPTADDRALYDAMVAFTTATEKPVERWGVLYEETRTRCRAWMDQAVEWFPQLYPQVVRDLLESDYYKHAVGAGWITPRFIWNKKSIKDLAMWLANRKKTNSIDSSGNNDWVSFDRLFLIDGKRITSQQLGNAIKW